MSLESSPSPSSNPTIAHLLETREQETHVCVEATDTIRSEYVISSGTLTACCFFLCLWLWDLSPFTLSPLPSYNFYNNKEHKPSWKLPPRYCWQSTCVSQYSINQNNITKIKRHLCLLHIASTPHTHNLFKITNIKITEKELLELSWVKRIQLHLYLALSCLWNMNELVLEKIERSTSRSDHSWRSVVAFVILTIGGVRLEILALAAEVGMCL